MICENVLWVPMPSNTDLYGVFLVLKREHDLLETGSLSELFKSYLNVCDRKCCRSCRPNGALVVQLSNCCHKPVEI